MSATGWRTCAGPSRGCYGARTPPRRSGQQLGSIRAVGNCIESHRGTRDPPGGDGWLVVHVDDEGIGVPESERPLVAEPFHRAWNVRESRIPGTGLGLYICRGIVERLGGRRHALTPSTSASGASVTGPSTRYGLTRPIFSIALVAAVRNGSRASWADTDRRV